MKKVLVYYCIISFIAYSIIVLRMFSFIDGFSEYKSVEGVIFLIIYSTFMYKFFCWMVMDRGKNPRILKNLYKRFNYDK